MFEHGSKTPAYLCMKQGAVFGNQGKGIDINRRGGGLLFGKMQAQRFARQHEYFQCALDTLAVGRLQAGGGLRVDVFQTAVQIVQTVPFFFSLNLCAYCRIRFGQAVQPFGQRVKIHHRAAND